MPAVTRTTTVARAARELLEVYERFREVEYQQIQPIVFGVLGDLSAADAVRVTREFGLRVPRTRRECIEAITRAISERKESWDRVEHIGGASPFTS
jgi:hypothetical protein